MSDETLSLAAFGPGAAGDGCSLVYGHKTAPVGGPEPDVGATRQKVN